MSAQTDRRLSPGSSIRGSMPSPLTVRMEMDVDDTASIATLESAEHTQHPLVERTYSEGTGDFRLAWLWVEGWRARLRKSGDIVEKSRWEWRIDDRVSHKNNVPIIVAKVPGVSVLKTSEVKSGRPRQKSVHWA